jgi:hypothetical protein
VIRWALVAAVIINLAYWTVWFGHRPWVASTTGRPYTQFEDAFPLADGWLTATCVLAWIGLHRRSPSALLWLIAAGGAGLYLFSMDVLYDLEHGIYAKGAGGVIEALVNVVTVAFASTALRWTWWHRVDLLGT